MNSRDKFPEGVIVGVLASIAINTLFLHDQVDYINVDALNDAVTSCLLGYSRIDVSEDTTGIHSLTSITCKDGSTISKTPKTIYNGDI